MELHRTPMGRQLIEKDIPRIATALERIATILERVFPVTKTDSKIANSPLGIGFAHKDHKQRKDGDVINGIYTYKESKDDKK